MNSSSSLRLTAGKDLDLENFLLRFLNLILHQEVPNYSLDKTIVVEWIRPRASKPRFSSSSLTAGKNLDLENFVKIPRPHN
jgi:hypothetical protein